MATVRAVPGTSVIPAERGDLIERIGRTHDAYKGLGARPLALEVSPQAEYELRRLLRTRDLPRLTVGGVDLPIEVNQKMIGVGAFKIKTAIGHITPAMARARFLANRSITK